MDETTSMETLELRYAGWRDDGERLNLRVEVKLNCDLDALVGRVKRDVLAGVDELEIGESAGLYRVSLFEIRWSMGPAPFDKLAMPVAGAGIPVEEEPMASSIRFSLQQALDQIDKHKQALGLKEQSA